LYAGGGLAFGLVLTIASFYSLTVFVNPLAAVLALFGNVYYVLGYSVLLKKSSVQNIVIVGGAVALPPLVVWAAATVHIGVLPLFLFVLFFFWTAARGAGLPGDYMPRGCPCRSSGRG
jgi:protoheme IX farnesyltransferase